MIPWWRLWWCLPEDANGPSSGLYVYYPLQDLMALVRLESWRRRCLVGSRLNAHCAVRQSKRHRHVSQLHRPGRHQPVCERQNLVLIDVSSERIRFGDQWPNAVSTIIEFSRNPIRLDSLVARLEGLGPQLRDSSEGPSWAAFQREVGQLFVFRRESTMVSSLLQERFDAQGRVLHLLNHAETADTHAWATPENLQRAVAALAARMDREHDMLVVYLTSHGARDHALAASHWPLQVAPATPELLRAALDAAGIRHRVIAVSACFSGGWIEPLATDSSLIMTAADATHTSYGCGTRSELTFFGRAVFHEQLRQTHSFTEAFAKAVPVIAQREVEAGKQDGFSNPQIHVGAQIVPVLRALEHRLQTAEAEGSAEAQVAAAGAKP